MNPWRGLGSLPRDVWIQCVATFINRSGTMVLPFLALYIHRTLEYSVLQAGLAITVYGFAAFVTAPFAGRICDRIGAKRVMVSSLFASGVMLFILPLTKDFNIILVLTFLWSVISEAFRPASLVSITEMVTPEQRKVAYSVNRLAINLGMSIGPAIGGFLILFSYPLLFVVDGTTSLAAGSILLLTRWKSGRESSPDGVSMTGEPRYGLNDEHRPAPAKDPALWYFLVSIVPVIVVFFQHEGAMPLYLVNDLHFSESSYGLLFTINTALIILFEVPLNIRMSHWSHRRSLALGSLLSGIGFGATGLVTTQLGVALTVVIWSFGEMILLPSASNYMADIAPGARRGAYMGLFQMTFSFSFAISGWLGTSTLQHFGGPALWAGTCIAGCLSAALLWRVKP